MATVAIVVLTLANNLIKGFWGFLVAFPLFNHCLGYVIDPKTLRGSKLPLIWRFIEFLRSKNFA
jgi:hypothetical protein